MIIEEVSLKQGIVNYQSESIPSCVHMLLRRNSLTAIFHDIAFRYSNSIKCPAAAQLWMELNSQVPLYDDDAQRYVKMRFSGERFN